MARILEVNELGAGKLVMLEEYKAGQVWLHPEAIQSNADGFVDMWHTIQKIEDYQKTYRCWDSIPTIQEQVETVWLEQ